MTREAHIKEHMDAMHDAIARARHQLSTDVASVTTEMHSVVQVSSEQQQSVQDSMEAKAAQAGSQGWWMRPPRQGLRKGGD